MIPYHKMKRTPIAQSCCESYVRKTKVLTPDHRHSATHCKTAFDVSKNAFLNDCLDQSNMQIHALVDNFHLYATFHKMLFLLLYYDLYKIIVF